eukprot:8466816-Heterocapsa_arctica.AAC.1
MAYGLLVIARAPSGRPWVFRGRSSMTLGGMAFLPDLSARTMSLTYFSSHYELGQLSGAHGTGRAGLG